MSSSERRRASLQAGVRMVLFMLLFTPQLALAAEQPQAARDLAELENFVIQDCGSCHGLTLKGGLGPALRPENLSHLPEAAIAAIIREGVPGTAMPPWKPLLTPAEIEWISHQLKTGALILP